MATKLIGRTVHILAPEQAREAQESPSIPGERPLKKKRIEYVIDLLENGDFCRADFAYATCADDSRRYRVNGNHTSHVLCACIDNPEMPDFPENVPLVVEEWTCDTVEELSAIFENYDNPQSNRTAGDRLGVHIAMHAESLDGCSNDVIAAALRGVNMARQHAKIEDEPVYRQWDLGDLLRNAEIVRFCHFLQPFKDDTWQGWKEKGVAAAVYRSWRESAETAEAIWSECFDEINDDDTSDSRRFVNKMRTERGRKQRTSDWFYNEALKYWKRRRKAIVA